MSNKIMRYLPIILILFLVIDGINIWVNSDSKVLLYLGVASTLVGTITIPFLIFYVHLEENTNPIALIGILSLVAYIIMSIIYTISFKNLDIDKWDQLNTMHRIQQTIASVINVLKYIAIIQLIDKKSNKTITIFSKYGAMLAISIYYLLQIIYYWIEKTNGAENIYNWQTLLHKFFEICVFAFVIYQMFDEKEEILVKREMPTTTGTNQPKPSFDTTPKFRNPALEAQEAIIASGGGSQVINSQQPQPYPPQPTISMGQNPSQQYGTQPMMNASQMLTTPPQGYTTQPTMNTQNMQQAPITTMNQGNGGMINNQ